MVLLMQKTGPVPHVLILSLTIFLTISSRVLAQETNISGVVRDINTHREIRGVNVYIKGSGIGSSSNFAGKFTFQVPYVNSDMVVVLQHIAYERKEISLDSARTVEVFYLQPRIIPLQSVQVEEKGFEQPEIEVDLPQTVSLIDAKAFEIRGYVDAGDLLRTDHSLQIEEDLSGKKTVSIRGGNADEVVVLFNGVKLNSTYDNVFDLALIDLEDVKRLEIIKGSNTALYGPEAFAGVINIVPKQQLDYAVRFQQRLGTYRSGNWGLHLYRNFKRLQGSYSLKRGGFRRTFIGEPPGNNLLTNTSLHHTGNLSYAFSASEDGEPINTLSAMWLYTSLDYDNDRDKLTEDSKNQIFSVNYKGGFSKLQDLDLTLTYRKLDEEQTVFNKITSSVDIEDRAVNFNARKQLRALGTDLILGYQYQRAELDVLRIKPNDPADENLTRQHHGFVGIFKYDGETGSDFLNTFNVDISLRHDRVLDKEKDRFNKTVDNTDWNESLFKFSLSANGYRNDFTFFGFLNMGSNTKFPTLLQQFDSQSQFTQIGAQPNLNPEKVNSVELGGVITKEITDAKNVDGWQFSLNFFQNHYDNKFRKFTRVDVPRPLYDNVQDASISGFESKSSIFFFRKKFTFELGLSKYFISEKAAFPFKSDFKRITNFIIDHAGYSFQVHWFTESEQLGWLLDQNDQFFQIRLPKETNLDLHLSKMFKIGAFKLFANASGRNLLNDSNEELLGLAIRDRRFYLTVGAQY